MIKTTLLALLVGLAVAQRGGFGGRRRQQQSTNTEDCPSQLQTFADCMAANAPSEAEMEAKRAAKDACFVDAGCTAPEGRGDKKQCLVDALEGSGLLSDLQTCASDAGLPSGDMVKKFFLRGGKGKGKGRGGRRGGRGGGRGGDEDGEDSEGGSRGGRGGRGGRKQERLLEACNGDSDAAGAVKDCMKNLRGDRSEGQGPMACMRNVDFACLGEAKQTMCTCMQPSIEANKDDFVSRVQACAGSDADSDDGRPQRDPADILERVCSSGGGRGGRGGRRGGGGRRRGGWRG